MKSPGGAAELTHSRGIFRPYGAWHDASTGSQGLAPLAIDYRPYGAWAPIL
jgi:hypothetical protein